MTAPEWDDEPCGHDCETGMGPGRWRCEGCGRITVEHSPEPNTAQLADLHRWLHDPTDTRTRDELRADLRALGDGIHPRNSDDRKVLQ
jgi:hypothetical protein